MKPSRPWILVVGLLLAIVVLSTVLQAINSLLWQLSYWLPGWLVGPTLLLLLAGIALTCYPLLKPWLGNLIKKNTIQPAKAAANRSVAAQQNLDALNQKLIQLKDAVAREALLERQREVEANLRKGDLVVVVFGSGSSGKTSLIRALINDSVGAVGATMGSTTESQNYRLHLQGLQRSIQLRDTPGILEAGDRGFEREQQAKAEAVRGDLLLFIVDGDLRASEFEVLEALAAIGKRLILVLNKCDLRGESEERRLLKLLYLRSKSFLNIEDIVSASGSPQSIPQPGHKPLQPQAEIERLLKRLAQVLREEGEDLLADNILLQSSRLAVDSENLLNQQRQRDAMEIVDRYGWIGAGVIALTPLPGLDLLATAAVNAQMVVEIGQIYGVSITKKQGQELALSLGRTLASLGLVKGGAGLLSTAMGINLPALLVSKAIQAVTGAWLTRLAGRSFISYFKQQQNWGDGGMAAVVKEQYDLERRDLNLNRFLEDALNRVVEPLKQQVQQLPPHRWPRGVEVREGPDDQVIKPITNKPRQRQRKSPP
jgi:small GTP-binding protein